MPTSKSTKKKTVPSKSKAPSSKKSAATKKTSGLILKGMIDGVSVSEMTKEQMVQYIMHMKAEVDREREERNFFQLERDKIQDFWNITKKQLNEKELELVKKHKEIEEIEKKFEQEIQLYKKRIRYMLHEQKSELSVSKIDNMKSLKFAEENFLLSENDFFQNQFLLKKQLRETETSYQDLIKDLKLKHCQEISKLKDGLQHTLEENELKCKSKFKKVCDDIEAKSRINIYNIEEEKNKQISILMEKHVDAFNDMRKNYNTVMKESISSSETLKQQVHELKKKEENLEQQVNKLNSNNKLLSDQLPNIEQQNCELQKKLLNYEKDKDSLLRTRVRLSKKKNEMKQLQNKMEITEQRCQELEEERNALKKNFINSIQEIQQKCGQKCIKLEEKLQVLKSEVENHNIKSKSNGFESEVL
ncbi:Dynein regulatory complex subunit 4 [Nymphon striatum]|nr:Dynein regulatory complex subunit 4 [Nymphon striatum]